VVNGPFDVLTSVSAASDLELDLAARPGSALVVARTKPAALYPGQAIVAARIDAEGDVDDPLTLSDMPNGEVRWPAVTATDSGFRVYYSDNRDNSASHDLRFRDVSAAGAAVGAPGDVTNTSAVLDGPLFVVDGDTDTLALWRVGGSSFVGTTLGADGAPSATPASLTASPALTSPLRLAFVDAVPYAAFFADGKVHTVSIATNGQSLGAPNPVSTAGAVQGRFDLASWANNRAVVFERDVTAGTEVRFVPLDSNAEAPYTEVTLSGQEGDGFSPSLAPLAGGYVVAYLHASGGADATARMLLVSEMGAIVDTHDLGAVAETTADMRVRVGTDGAVYVVWEDETTVLVPGDDVERPGTVIRGAVARCN
jgi:hypothetical protein